MNKNQNSNDNSSDLGETQRIFSELTKELQDVIADAMVARAKEINFKHGLPITYEKDGFVVDEYSDGRIVKIKAIKTPSIHE